MIKVAIFDLDGTLVESLHDLCDSTNFALKKYNLPERQLWEFNYLVGDGVQKLIERAIGEEKFNPQLHKNVYDAFMGHYREHYLDKTVPYDGIKESIKELQKDGIVMVVLSNKVDEMAVKVVDKLFDGEFKAVIGKRAEYPLKPDPTLTLEIIKGLGVEPFECAFFGDSGMDMATAKNAGCVAVGVLWGFRTKEELLESGAEYLLSNPKEISQFITEFNK